MNLPNLKLASQRCCATCKWFNRDEEFKWCGNCPTVGEEYDDFCDVHEGMVCDNWEKKK